METRRLAKIKAERANRRLISAEQIQRVSNNIVTLAMIFLSIPAVSNLISEPIESLRNISMYSAITLLIRGGNYINVKVKKTQQGDAMNQYAEVQGLENEIIALKSYKIGREFDDESVNVVNRLLQESEPAN